MSSERADADHDPTAPSETDVGAASLFIDTGAFFAYYNDRDQHYERARAVFRAIRSGALADEPLYTTRFVLAELATLLLHKIDHATTSRALRDVQAGESSNVEHAAAGPFVGAVEEFDRYDDHEITLVDHLTAVLARERGVEHVFSFDGDFRTLGFTVVPADTGEP